MAKVKQGNTPGVFYVRSFYTTRLKGMVTTRAATFDDAIKAVQKYPERFIGTDEDKQDAIVEVWEDFTMKTGRRAVIDMRKEGEPQSWLAADFVKALAAQQMPQNLVECAEVLLRLITQAKTLCDRDPVQIETQKETV